MDGYTIAFGIRNVTHIEKALSEAYRLANLETKQLLFFMFQVFRELDVPTVSTSISVSILHAVSFD
jgi:ubiquinone/menaquinone biosynthesis C-methylase UbiE